MSTTEARPGARLGGALLTAGVALVFVGLSAAMLSLPPGPVGLCEAVDAQLACTGVRNPVTAVLLNFRGYDTLLELAVLLLAIVAIRALRRGQMPRAGSPGPVLTVLVGVQAPAMILVAGYLLWSGADAPGGAFQAGAVLAAAAVMLALGDRHAPRHLRGLPLRAGLAFGLAAFLGAGILGALIGDAFLAYPPHLAAAMVFCIEIAAAISIGLVLFDIFASVLRRRAGTGSTPGEGSR